MTCAVVGDKLRDEWYYYRSTERRNPEDPSQYIATKIEQVVSAGGAANVFVGLVEHAGVTACLQHGTWPGYCPCVKRRTVLDDKVILRDDDDYPGTPITKLRPDILEATHIAIVDYNKGALDQMHGWLPQFYHQHVLLDLKPSRIPQLDGVITALGTWPRHWVVKMNELEFAQVWGDKLHTSGWTIMVTGERPVLFYRTDAGLQTFFMDHSQSYQPDPVTVCGAGDVFSSAWLHYRVTHPAERHVDALIYAHAAATKAVASATRPHTLCYSP